MCVPVSSVHVCALPPSLQISTSSLGPQQQCHLWSFLLSFLLSTGGLVLAVLSMWVLSSSGLALALIDNNCNAKEPPGALARTATLCLLPPLGTTDRLHSDRWLVPWACFCMLVMTGCDQSSCAVLPGWNCICRHSQPEWSKVAGTIGKGLTNTACRPLPLHCIAQKVYVAYWLT